MSFKIVITDNNNGNIVVNENNATAIIGAFHTADKHTGEMAFARCSTEDLIGTLVGAKGAVKRVESTDPFVKMVSQSVEKFGGEFAERFTKDKR